MGIVMYLILDMQVVLCKMLVFTFMLGAACLCDNTAARLPSDINLYTSKYPVFT